MQVHFAKIRSTVATLATVCSELAMPLEQVWYDTFKDMQHGVRHFESFMRFSYVSGAVAIAKSKGQRSVGMTTFLTKVEVEVKRPIFKSKDSWLLEAFVQYYSTLICDACSKDLVFLSPAFVQILKQSPASTT